MSDVLYQIGASDSQIKQITKDLRSVMCGYNDEDLLEYLIRTKQEYLAIDAAIFILDDLQGVELAVYAARSVLNYYPDCDGCFKNMVIAAINSAIAVIVNPCEATKKLAESAYEKSHRAVEYAHIQKDLEDSDWLALGSACTSDAIEAASAAEAAARCATFPLFSKDTRKDATDALFRARSVDYCRDDGESSNWVELAQFALCIYRRGSFYLT